MLIERKWMTPELKEMFSLALETFWRQSDEAKSKVITD